MDRPRLATDLFLVAHDEFSGRLRVSADLLGCGLVGALLAELVAADRVVVESGRVLSTDALADGTDELGDYVVDAIRRQDTTHTVRAWVDVLRDVLPGLVADRLVDEGVVRREEGGRLLRRRPDRFPASDLLAASRPRLRLAQMVRSPQEFDLAGAMLAVLLGALGVESVLEPDLDRYALRDIVHRLEENLPADLRAVFQGVRAAVAAVSLTVRR